MYLFNFHRTGWYIWIKINIRHNAGIDYQVCRVQRIFVLCCRYLKWRVCLHLWYVELWYKAYIWIRNTSLYYMMYVILSLDQCHINGNTYILCARIFICDHTSLWNKKRYFSIVQNTLPFAVLLIPFLLMSAPLYAQKNQRLSLFLFSFYRKYHIYIVWW